MSYIEEQSALKAAFAVLDEKGPSGWWNLIDLDTLDMNSGQKCVLGQLYGHKTHGRSGYAVGLSTLGLTPLSDSYEAFNGATATPIWVSAIITLRATRGIDVGLPAGATVSDDAPVKSKMEVFAAFVDAHTLSAADVLAFLREYESAGKSREYDYPY